MKGCMIGAVLWVMILQGVWGNPEETTANEPVSTKTESSKTESSTNTNNDTPNTPIADKDTKNQFWFAGTSNYHLLLHESETQVDNQMDRPFRLLIPDWKRPTTFKDWCRDYKVWDIWAGYGRILSPNLSWSIYGGGGAGTVPNNRHYYPLLLPLKFKIDFTRVSIMLGTSVTWYPFGRPEKKTGGFFKNLANIRPMAEMNIGYSHQVSIGDIRINAPGAGQLLHVKQDNQYDLLWASPRLGLEMPLTENDSLNVLGGYLFFNEHSAEYNGVLLEFFIRHRF